MDAAPDPSSYHTGSNGARRSGAVDFTRSGAGVRERGGGDEQGAQQQMPQALPGQPLIDEKTVTKVPEPAN